MFGSRYVVPACAALCAAVAAHVAIDVLGDSLLPHDTYDDVAHGSRLAILGVAALLAALASIVAIAAAVREARGSTSRLRRLARSAVALPAPWFYALTVFGGTVVLVAMEALDNVAAGSDVDDLGDLFGGSLVLGGATVVALSLVVALLARTLLRAFAGARASLVRVLVLVFRRRTPVARVSRGTLRHDVSIVRPPLRARARVAGRAPPAGCPSPT